MEVAKDVAPNGADDADDVDDADEFGALDELDPAPALSGARRRRSYSRPRARSVNAARGVQRSALRGSSVPVTLADQATQRVQSIAERVAREICDNNLGNLDLVCKVFGVTHRGGFKLRVVHLEEVTSSMVDRWRAVCLTRGYASTVAFDVTASEATVVATPLLKTPRWAGRCGSTCGKMDPLNAVFAGALALNTLRHALAHFA